MYIYIYKAARIGFRIWASEEIQSDSMTITVFARKFLRENWRPGPQATHPLSVCQAKHLPALFFPPPHPRPWLHPFSSALPHGLNSVGAI